LQWLGAQGAHVVVAHEAGNEEKQLQLKLKVAALKTGKA